MPFYPTQNIRKTKKKKKKKKQRKKKKEEKEKRERTSITDESGTMRDHLLGVLEADEGLLGRRLKEGDAIVETEIERRTVDPKESLLKFVQKSLSFISKIFS